MLSIRNGDVSYERNYKGQMEAAIYVCHPGFTLDGPPLRYCHQGKWSGSQCRCQPGYKIIIS